MNDMSNINCSDLKMCIEKNLYEMVSEHKHWSKSTVYNTSSVLQTVCSVPFHVFNSITAANLKDEDLDLQIKKIIKPYLSAGVPVCWYVTPSSKPLNIGKCLIANDFTLAAKVKAMAMEIDIKIAPKINNDLIIKEVDSQIKIKDWVGVLCKGYNLPEFVERSYCEFYSAVLSNQEAKIKGVICYDKEKPVGIANLICGDNSAAIYDVVTIPSARCQGIATCMSKFLLVKAGGLGYEKCTVISTPQAHGLYKKIGFKDYGDVNCYLLDKNC